MTPPLTDAELDHRAEVARVAHDRTRLRTALLAAAQTLGGSARAAVECVAGCFAGEEK